MEHDDNMLLEDIVEESDEFPSLKNLSTSINESLEQLNEMNDTNQDIEEKKIKKDSSTKDKLNNLISTYKNELKELVLFVFLYYVFSLDVVKDRILVSFHSLVKKKSPNVTTISILFYGTILGSMFIMIKKYVKV